MARHRMCSSSFCFFLWVGGSANTVCKMGGQTDRRTDRQTGDGRTNRLMEGQMYGQSNRHTDRQTDRQKKAFLSFLDLPN